MGTAPPPEFSLFLSMKTLIITAWGQWEGKRRWVLQHRIWSALISRILSKYFILQVQQISRVGIQWEFWSKRWRGKLNNPPQIWVLKANWLLCSWRRRRRPSLPGPGSGSRERWGGPRSLKISRSKLTCPPALPVNLHHYRTISFADIGNESKGLVDPSIYDDTLQKDYLLPDSKNSKAKLGRTGSLGPSGLEYPLYS